MNRSMTHHKARCEVTRQGLSLCLEYQKNGQCRLRATYSSTHLAKEIYSRSVSSI